MKTQRTVEKMEFDELERNLIGITTFNAVETSVGRALKAKVCNSKVTRNILQEQSENSSKDRLIDSLKRELEFNRGKNANLIHELDLTKRQLSSVSLNKGKMEKYCKMIKTKFKNFVETIEMYEGTINTIKNETQGFINEQEGIMEQYEQDMENICDQTNFLKEKVQTQIKVTDDRISEADKCKETLQNELREFLEEKRLQQSKLNELQAKYDYLEQSVKEYDTNSRLKEGLTVFNIAEQYTSGNKAEEIKILLSERQVQNECLRNEVVNLTSRINTVRSGEAGQEKSSYYKSTRLNSERSRTENGFVKPK